MIWTNRRWPAAGIFLVGVLGASWPVWAQVAASSSTADLHVTALPPAVRQGRALLAAGKFQEARVLFTAFLREHPHSAPAQLGLGDAEAGLHQFEAAELVYRRLTAEQPQLWQAHKDLLPVEAALGRWEDFEAERTILRAARERGAPGISARESDIIDRFEVHGNPWVVRAYFEPVGRSEARVNFESFSPEGRVLEYLSLENPSAAAAALQPNDVHIGSKSVAGPANSGDRALALNWYTGTAHGTIRSYTQGEPPYRQLRRDVLQWLQKQPKPMVTPGPR